MDGEKISKKYMRHGTEIEIIWTIIPGIILILIAIPSFKLLYLIDEVGDVDVTVKVSPLKGRCKFRWKRKVIGKQWYWEYEYSDYEKDPIESYMIPTEDLTKGQLRLLEVDNRLVLRIKKKIRFIVSPFKGDPKGNRRRCNTFICSSEFRN